MSLNRFNGALEKDIIILLLAIFFFFKDNKLCDSLRQEGCRAALSDTTDASPLKFQNNVLRARPHVQPIGGQLLVTSSRPVVICPLPHCYRFLLQRKKLKFQKAIAPHATSTSTLISTKQYCIDHVFIFFS